MLSKNEYKYRSKTIAENHFKKDMQKYLDKHVKDCLLTYKKIYLDRKCMLNMLVSYNFRKIGNVAKQLGESFAQVTDVLQNLKANITIQQKDNFIGDSIWATM